MCLPLSEFLCMFVALKCFQSTSQKKEKEKINQKSADRFDLNHPCTGFPAALSDAPPLPAANGTWTTSAVLFVWWNVQQLKTQKCFSETASHSHEQHCQLCLHFNNSWTHITKDGMSFMSESIMWESGQSKVLFQRPDREERAAFSTYSLIDNKRLHNTLCFKDFQIVYNISQLLFLHD